MLLGEDQLIRACLTQRHPGVLAAVGLNEEAFRVAWAGFKAYLLDLCRNNQGATILHFARVVDVQKHTKNYCTHVAQKHHFMLNEGMIKTHALAIGPGITRPLSLPDAPVQHSIGLNFAFMAVKYAPSLTKVQVSICIKNMIEQLEYSMCNGAYIHLDLGIGYLTCRDKKVSFAFIPELGGNADPNPPELATPARSRKTENDSTAYQGSNIRRSSRRQSSDALTKAPEPKPRRRSGLTALQHGRLPTPYEEHTVLLRASRSTDMWEAQGPPRHTTEDAERSAADRALRRSQSHPVQQHRVTDASAASYGRDSASRQGPRTPLHERFSSPMLTAAAQGAPATPQLAARLSTPAALTTAPPRPQTQAGSRPETPFSIAQQERARAAQQARTRPVTASPSLRTSQYGLADDCSVWNLSVAPSVRATAHAAPAGQQATGPAAKDAPHAPALPKKVVYQPPRAMTEKERLAHTKKFASALLQSYLTEVQQQQHSMHSGHSQQHNSNTQHAGHGASIRPKARAARVAASCEGSQWAAAKQTGAASRAKFMAEAQRASQHVELQQQVLAARREKAVQQWLDASNTSAWQRLPRTSAAGAIQQQQGRVSEGGWASKTTSRPKTAQSLRTHTVRQSADVVLS